MARRDNHARDAAVCVLALLLAATAGSFGRRGRAPAEWFRKRAPVAAAAALLTGGCCYAMLPKSHVSTNLGDWVRRMAIDNQIANAVEELHANPPGPPSAGNQAALLENHSYLSQAEHLEQPGDYEYIRRDDGWQLVFLGRDHVPFTFEMSSNGTHVVAD